MKKAVAVLIALALMSCGALAEERSFALNREQGSDVYAWDGAQLTQSDAYFSIYSVTNGKTAPEDELFAAQSANQSLPEDSDYIAPRYALLDWKGKQLTDFLYDSIDYDPSGDVLIYAIDGLFGAMTRSLQELFPCEYDSVMADGEGGFLLVTHSDVDAPPVLHMDKGGKPVPTGVNARFYWGSLTDGLCAAVDENGAYGFLNGQGQWAIKPKYEWVQNFSADYAIVRQKNKSGIIDKTGKWTVKPTYDEDRGLLSDGSIAVLMRGTRAYFVRPSDGKPLFSIRLSKDGYVSTGYVKPMIAVTDKGKSTLYDATGKKILSLDDSYSFDLWSAQPDDRLLATSVSAGVLMDLSGKTLFKGQGLSFLDTVDGQTLYTSSRFKTRMVQYQGEDNPVEESVYETYRYGMVDSDGKTLLPMIYRQLYPLITGRYYVQDAQRWGVIDQTGKWIVSGSLYGQLMD
jgi:hypothetical protein